MAPATKIVNPLYFWQFDFIKYLSYIWSKLGYADNDGKEMNKNQDETKSKTRMLHIRVTGDTPQKSTYSCSGRR